MPSILIGSETDPWMPVAGARELARRLGSAFVNLGAAEHINTAAGFGPWPRAKYLVDTLVHCAAPRRFRVAADEAEQGDAAAAVGTRPLSARARTRSA